ncbi:hypothetical protein DACRYDRAFT_111436 [Dacryopinax primogenitus]|uniref:Protein kinase domain-containing protein n=1 Tax=Dacryopinax primogenitus (strain DJM 731) TaxID=1858805 RepID=M5FWU1_DACPD|nr:uncharacterized protein DACRYDRAFT_111436 [Dacryopinax primogenitus]EJT97916.1 hypothetical protein DACRYDRAFT_111436 [Dacryopinax primogenitus]
MLVNLTMKKQHPVTQDPTGDPGTSEPPVDLYVPPYGRTEAELNWSAVQPYLQSRGYMLRPRYHPGWVGSWVGTKKKPEKCVDSIGISEHGVVINAIRMRDGAPVLLKIWSSTSAQDGNELAVLQYFSDPARSGDPDNRCVPLLDTIDMTEWQERGVDYVLAFEVGGDAFVANPDFERFLQGLAYMHSHNVFHGDIHPGNIRMDAKNVFPKGIPGPYNFHPDHPLLMKQAKRFNTMQAPPKYYYIDFGSSTMFPSYEERKLVQFNAAAFIPPECKNDADALYDGFKADILQLGATITILIRACDRPELNWVIYALLSRMLKRDPEERPPIEALATAFREVLRDMSNREMRQRLSWTKKASPPFPLKVRYWFDYLGLWWQSFRYGLPDDILLNDPSELTPTRPTRRQAANTADREAKQRLGCIRETRTGSSASPTSNRLS